MNIYIEKFLCVLLGYCFGCIQCSYILGKITRKIDIRDYGSGNAGTTNALRVLGRKAGILTLIGDLLKTVLALLIAALIFGYDQKQMLLWTGLGVFLGHNHPFYMQFKGGKGVAVMIGIFMFSDVRMLAAAGIPALILLYFTKYVSLGSITYMVLLIAASLIFYSGKADGMEVIMLTLLMAAVTVFRHRANIRRLIAGTERKLGQKVSVDTAKTEEPSAKNNK